MCLSYFGAFKIEFVSLGLVILFFGSTSVAFVQVSGPLRSTSPHFQPDPCCHQMLPFHHCEMTWQNNCTFIFSSLSLVKYPLNCWFWDWGMGWKLTDWVNNEVRFMHGSIWNHDLRFNLNMDHTTSFVYSTFQRAQNHILQPIALSIVIVFISLCSYMCSAFLQFI